MKTICFCFATFKLKSYMCIRVDGTSQLGTLDKLVPIISSSRSVRAIIEWYLVGKQPTLPILSLSWNYFKNTGQIFIKTTTYNFPLYSSWQRFTVNHFQ